MSKKSGNCKPFYDLVYNELNEKFNNDSSDEYSYSYSTVMIVVQLVKFIFITNCIKDNFIISLWVEKV